jgi:hypothetical protein
MTFLQYRCSDPRQWVQFGLFRRVADQLAYRMNTLGGRELEEGDDDE